jgi:Sec-independent protein secretion pathway component TatC
VFLLILAGGISFTTPVFVYSVIRLGFVDASFFSKNRVVIWFGTLVITALFITPDGGPLLDLVLFVPIITLLEVAVFFAKRSSRSGATGRVSRGAKPGKCRYCSSLLGTGAIFCPKCGKSIG